MIQCDMDIHEIINRILNEDITKNIYTFTSESNVVAIDSMESKNEIEITCEGSYI